ncbi:MAG: hypothetical protein GY818_05010 [Planctomycetaceae bacterium]|nr:hypothetical protein [Planctomycetaceae bacterium]
MKNTTDGISKPERKQCELCDCKALPGIRFCLDCRSKVIKKIDARPVEKTKHNQRITEEEEEITELGYVIVTERGGALSRNREKLCSAEELIKRHNKKQGEGN